MTVQQLIDILGTYDHDLEVFVDGYEGGYEKLQCNQINNIRVSKDVVNPENWYGDYESDADGIDSLLLSRE